MEESTDLRTRRRLQTEREVHRAALSLFEDQGVRATTVRHIADLAGISSRTFFRYFSSKEEAAMPVQRRLIRAIDSLDFSDTSPGDALGKIEDAMVEIMSEDSSPEAQDHRRISRLFATDAEFDMAATGQERAVLEKLLGRIRATASDWSEPDALLVAELALTGWRTAWMVWGESVSQRPGAAPAEVYRECLARRRRLIAHPEVA
ncbi:TetR family transcriptional regulator [Rothia sp. HC945]|uniref:TetR/AcrR family transcriptional regulator n=1 Tax=Rothia sp. HC945 TaxID=3171170 RepID=UPI0026535A97|nr:TetR family transcriptional regulator [Kocuria sp.]MDN5618225.1 TetR family transcriptional regulator [Kocuria sp.]